MQVNRKFARQPQGVLAMSKIFTFCKDALLFPILLFIAFLVVATLMNSPLIRALWMEGI
jgi:hypothetical protein